MSLYAFAFVGLSMHATQFASDSAQFQLRVECLAAVQGGPVVLKATLAYFGERERHVRHPFPSRWLTVRPPDEWGQSDALLPRFRSGIRNGCQVLRKGDVLTEYAHVHHDRMTIPVGGARVGLAWPIDEYGPDEQRDWRGRALARPSVVVEVLVEPATPERLASVRLYLETELARSSPRHGEWKQLADWVFDTKHEALLPVALRFLHAESPISPSRVIWHIESVSADKERGLSLLVDHICGKAPGSYPAILDHWRENKIALASSELNRLSECPSPWIRAITYLTCYPHAESAWREALLEELRGNLPPRRLEQIRRLLAELGDDSFDTRERATESLEQLAETAVGPLRRVLADRPPPEVRRRIEAILVKLDQAHANWENRLAFALLERYGTPPARQILEAMAMGPEDLWRTKEARAVLERLAKKK